MQTAAMTNPDGFWCMYCSQALISFIVAGSSIPQHPEQSHPSSLESAHVTEWRRSFAHVWPRLGHSLLQLSVVTVR